MIAKIKSLLSSNTAIEIFWLYLVILIPTIVFKIHYLDRLVGGGLPALAADILPDGHPVFFFGRDIVEVLILALLIYLPAKFLLRKRAHYLTVCAVFACIAVQLANWVSIMELATLITPNSMAVSISWVIDNPEHLSSYIHRRRDIVFLLMGAAGILLWSFLPRLIPHQLLSSKESRNWHSYLVVASIALLLPVSLVSASLATSFGEPAPVPLRGYWSSTAKSLFVSLDTNLLSLEIPPRKELENSYRHIVYPTGRPANRLFIENLTQDAIRRRHILILSLETAPQKYYPIINNPDFATFFEMSQHAIVSENHYANSPFTTRATFAMLSGMYPNPAGGIAKYGDFQTDGLATVLDHHGYESVYIDSYKIDWIKGAKFHDKMWRNLGFNDLLENAGDEDLELLVDKFDRRLRSEEKSLQKAAEAILKAEQQGKKAVVFIDSIFGHYKWLAEAGREDLPGKQKLYQIARQFDVLLGDFLSLIKENNIGQDIIVVVTGDHGLRYQDEFNSLNEETLDAEIAFNVPFLLYAPGLFDQQVFLPYATSHVDLTPTILELVGIENDNFYHHGENMLSAKLHNRVTFMMNTRLSSIDRFHWQGIIVSYNNLTGETNISKGPPNIGLFVGMSEKDIRNHVIKTFPNIGDLFESANRHFNLSAAYSLQRSSTAASLKKQDSAIVPPESK